jgi:hypothetical protein
LQISIGVISIILSGYVLVYPGVGRTSKNPFQVGSQWKKQKNLTYLIKMRSADYKAKWEHLLTMTNVTKLSTSSLGSISAAVRFPAYLY